MKRQIICLNCYAERLPLGYGESVVRMAGMAKRDFYCDLCGSPIKKGEECRAESIMAPGQTYYTWEKDYIL